MANNPNPKHIRREGEQMRQAADELRQALLNIEKLFLLVNSNFYPKDALMAANDAIREANNQTRRLHRRHRLQALRRLHVGHPNRRHWYKCGDGRPNALQLGENAHSKYQLSLTHKLKRRFTYC